MKEPRDEFLRDLEKDKKLHWKKYRQLRLVQISVMIFVGLAGVLTTSAGVNGLVNPWLPEPALLLILGMITTIGAIIDQWAKPGQRSEFALQIKMALLAIEEAVKFQNLSIEKAQDLRRDARDNPEKALIKLSGKRDN